jgi:hypothetical protein
MTGTPRRQVTRKEQRANRATPVSDEWQDEDPPRQTLASFAARELAETYAASIGLTRD